MILPNPASELLTVKFYAEQEAEATIVIVDAVGQIMLKQKVRAIKGNNSIMLKDLSKFSNGVYTLQLQMEHDVQATKLIIQK